MLQSCSRGEHIPPKNLFTLGHVSTFPMEIACVFLGEYGEGIFRGLGKATADLSATESCFLRPQCTGNFALSACSGVCLLGRACEIYHHSGLELVLLRHLLEKKGTRK